MARASIATCQGLLYEYLGIRAGGSSFGTLTANERYSLDYTNNELYSADTETVRILIGAKQDELLSELYATQASVTSGTTVSNNWAIIRVENASGLRGIEVDWDTYVQLSEGGIFDTLTYKDYYTLKDGKIYFIFASAATITYIDLARQTTLRSPAGFEPAVAFKAAEVCLMKRADNPDAAKFYSDQFKEFISVYMSPQSAEQEMADK